MFSPAIHCRVTDYHQSRGFNPMHSLAIHRREQCELILSALLPCEGELAAKLTEGSD